MRDSFIFYSSFYEAINVLSDDSKSVIYNAIFEYVFENKEPKLDGVNFAIFTLIKPQLLANNRRYENGCKGAEFGHLGGAPKGNTNAKKDKETTPKQPQNNPKTTPNDNDNVNDNENVNENDSKYPYRNIMSLYNDTCKSFPRLTVMSGKRKKAINARIKSGYTYDDFLRLFTIAESSDFLKGKNERNWSATFDWLTCDGNMAKVLDGNYNNKSGKGGNGSFIADMAEILQERGEL